LLDGHPRRGVVRGPHGELLRTVLAPAAAPAIVAAAGAACEDEGRDGGRAGHAGGAAPDGVTHVVAPLVGVAEGYGAAGAAASRSGSGSCAPLSSARAMRTEELTVQIGATAAGAPAAVTFSGRQPSRVRRASIQASSSRATSRSPSAAAVMA